jgi:hypothetical protein
MVRLGAGIDLTMEIRRRIASQFGWGIDGPWVVVLNALQTTISDFSYGTIQIGEVQPTNVITDTFRNGTDLPDNQSFSATESKQVTHTWTVTTGISANISLNLKIPTPDIGFGLGGSTTITTTDTSTTSVTTSYSGTSSFPIPAHTRVDITLILNETRVSIPFSGRASLQGPVSAMSDMFGLDPVGIGQLFRVQPHPSVEVVNDSLIRCPIAGQFDGVSGVDWQVKSEQFPIGAEKNSRPLRVTTISQASVGQTKRNY